MAAPGSRLTPILLLAPEPGRLLHSSLGNCARRPVRGSSVSRTPFRPPTPLLLLSCATANNSCCYCFTMPGVSSQGEGRSQQIHCCELIAQYYCYVLGMGDMRVLPSFSSSSSLTLALRQVVA